MSPFAPRSKGAAKRHRWPQYSLRALLISVSFLSVALSWFGAHLRSARTQSAAVQWLTSAEARVTYDDEAEGKAYSGLLVDLLGRDFFARVYGVDFSHEDSVGDVRKATDEDLAHVGLLPDLRELNLAASQYVSDDGMLHLARLVRLKKLDLSWTRIGDTGLARLDKLTNLEDLNLYQLPITDAGLATLEGFKKLEGLYIGGGPVTDKGLVHLKGLTKLTRLCINCKGVTSRGVANLRPLVRLRELDLQLTHVDDRAMADIEQFRDIRRLDLSNTPITNAAIATISRLKNLEELELYSTGVADGALKKLSALKRLTRLSLEDTAVTDRSIPDLEGLGNLKRLSVSIPFFTPGGMAKLERSLEKTTVECRHTNPEEGTAKGGQTFLPRLPDHTAFPN